MYNVKEFNELEAKALKEGLYVDPQLVTATPDFAAATCTVSDKNGKRIFRAVSGKSVAEVTEQAITLALCAHYEKPVPALFAVENVSLPADAPVDTPSVGSGKQSRHAAKAGTPQRNQNDAKATQTPAAGDQPAEKQEDDKTIQTPTVGAQAGSEKENKKAADKNNAATDAQAPAGSADAATDTQVPAGGTDAATDAAMDAAPGGAEDFRVMVGKYRTREDNYIKQMLETKEGRDFLTKVINIGTPSAQIKPYVEQTKAYLASHGIQL